MAIQRLSTGIDGLNKLMEGGIPKGFTILVAGNPGTGKTILASHFLYEGLKNGESTVYVSFSESKQQYLSNTERLEMNLAKFENHQGNTFTFLDFTSVNKDGIQDALDELLEVVQKTKATRMVVDSFSAIAQAFGSQNEARIALQVVLGKIMRAEGVTNMLISEVPLGQFTVGSGIEEFVVDGIIKLDHGTTNAAPMTLRIVKMRGTAMNREAHFVSIGPNGMILYAKQPLIMSFITSEERLASGIEGLDKRIEGGFLRGSTTTLVGASGVGKTTISFQFIAEGIENGGNGIFYSLEESPEQIRRMATKFGYDIEELERKGLTIVSSVAEEHNPDTFISYLSDLIKEKNPSRLVIDGLSSFEHSYKEGMYLLAKRIVSLAHDHQITSILTILTSQESGFALTSLGISSLFENIIMLRYVEAEGRMKRSLILMKMRATSHDDTILEFSISHNARGAQIVGDMSGYVGILTGVAQKASKEFHEQEDSIAKTEDDERKRRLLEFQADEKEIEANQRKGREGRRTAFEKRVEDLGKEE